MDGMAKIFEIRNKERNLILIITTLIYQYNKSWVAKIVAIGTRVLCINQYLQGVPEKMHLGFGGP